MNDKANTANPNATSALDKRTLRGIELNRSTPETQNKIIATIIEYSTFVVANMISP